MGSVISKRKATSQDVESSSNESVKRRKICTMYDGENCRLIPTLPDELSWKHPWSFCANSVVNVTAGVGFFLGPNEGLAVSIDGLLCCTISNDHAVKIYDVVNYDMMAMIRLPYIPGAVEWVYKQGDVKAKLAVSHRNSSSVHIYDPRSGSNEPIASREIHMNPIKVMKYNPVSDTMISGDTKELLLLLLLLLLLTDAASRCLFPSTRRRKVSLFRNQRKLSMLLRI